MRKTIAILAVIALIFGSLDLAFARGGGGRGGSRSMGGSRSKRGKNKSKDAKRDRERTGAENRDALKRDIRRDDA
jgi:hypothetical protein